jgi:hypothetical protein
MSWALVGRAAGGGAGTGAFFATRVVSPARAVRGGTGFTPGPPSTAVAAAGAVRAPDASILARNRRATGASIVLDADFTYSPIS